MLNVEVIRDPQTGESRGFGFVLMAIIAEVKQAKQTLRLDRGSFHGWIISVERARRSRRHHPTLGPYEGRKREYLRNNPPLLNSALLPMLT